MDLPQASSGVKMFQNLFKLKLNSAGVCTKQEEQLQTPAEIESASSQN